jgi:2-octaprenyl-6-methoxyphenol hydroxylase
MKPISCHAVLMSNRSDVDIAVVGGGASGLAAAIAAAIAGFRVAVFAPVSEIAPSRTAALLAGSVALLTDLDVWPLLERHSAPLRTIRIVDATRRILRAPEVAFHASEVGLPAFGHNVPNVILVDALRRHASGFDAIEIIERPVTSVDLSGERPVLSDGTQTWTPRLVVAADGINSTVRDAAGINLRRWTYRQSALVATFSIAVPHRNASTEFHTEAGPLTLVPLPGDRVSLVWVDRPDEIERHLALEADDFSRLVERRVSSIHGAMQLDGPRAAFPLSAALADRYAARRAVLVGEAAHLFPPIGAQGLNLGFRDVEALRGLFRRYHDDPGAATALAAYDTARRGDIRSRTLAVDLLNRSLLTGLLPVQAIRGLGIGLAIASPGFRRALMRRGLAA